MYLTQVPQKKGNSNLLKMFKSMKSKNLSRQNIKVISDPGLATWESSSLKSKFNTTIQPTMKEKNMLLTHKMRKIKLKEDFIRFVEPPKIIVD